ncbi:MAG: hypothetical protein ACTSPV_16920 [Candidatus Hodarchaeales archaeon]
MYGLIILAWIGDLITFGKFKFVEKVFNEIEAAFWEIRKKKMKI